MNKQKILWDKLAKDDAKAYIRSNSKNEEIDFKESGKNNCFEYIYDDPIIKSNINFKESNMLEIGCGVGRMTEFMANNFKKVYAVDISGEMVKQGKERLNNIQNIEWMENDGESFNLPDNSIDFVFSYLVFQHMPNKTTIENNFKDVHRILKKDGVFKVRIRGEKTLSNKWYSGYNFNMDSAKILCEDTGFEIIKFEYGKRFWLWLKK